MRLPQAVDPLSARAHGHRLPVFRLLLRAGANGLRAGEITRELEVLPNTLSSHLTIPGHAGLVESRRDGHSAIHSADHDRMRALLGFLLADCGDGHPEIRIPFSIPFIEAAQKCNAP